MGLSFKKRKVGNASVFRCEGEFVYGPEIVDLHRAVKAALPKTPNVVLDLARVPVMDSAGIGTLCGIYTSTLSAHGGLKVVGVTERVRHVLRITKVLTLLDIYDSEEAALRSIKSAAAS